MFGLSYSGTYINGGTEFANPNLIQAAGGSNNLLITLEHAIHINKAAIALITAVLCWTILVLNPTIKVEALAALGHHLSSVAEIVFFLLGAMTIVELIDAHDGFQNITEKIKTTNKNGKRRKNRKNTSTSFYRRFRRAWKKDLKAGFN